MNKDSTSQSKKKNSARKPIFFVALSVLALVIVWAILTVVIPLVKGTGIDKYQGVQRQLGEAIVNFKKSDEPSGPSVSLYQVHIEDIHAVTKEEITQFCKDPAYITEDSNDSHFYTVVVSEQYLFNPSVKKTTYVGCNHTDYIYTQAFGYPKGLDPRAQPER